MNQKNPLESAAKRLVSAIDALEAALARRQQADRDEAGMAAQLHTLGADRSRLTAELDSQLARARRLETTNREVARRLDVAIDSIRAVVDGRGH
jgi:hypothetical protein